MENSSAPVVVYCDGSASSLEAALWAIDEALWRRTWMRLVAVVTPGDADFDDQLTAKRRILRSAAAIVRAANERVLVSVELLIDNPVTALAAESNKAAVMCVGVSRDGAGSSVGCRLARLSTSTPVALVGRRRTYPDPVGDRWVVAVLGDDSTARAVWQTAVQEARMRGAAVMVLTTSGKPTQEEAIADLEPCCDEDDLEVWMMPGSTVVTRLLELEPELEHTVVVGATDGALINEMVSPPTGLMSRMAGNSLLVVPNPDHCPPMSPRRQTTPVMRDDRPAWRSCSVLAGSSRSS